MTVKMKRSWSIIILHHYENIVYLSCESRKMKVLGGRLGCNPIRSNVRVQLKWQNLENIWKTEFVKFLSTYIQQKTLKYFEKIFHKSESKIQWFSYNLHCIFYLCVALILHHYDDICYLYFDSRKGKFLATD